MPSGPDVKYSAGYRAWSVPTVSVIIPTYNRADLLAAAIESSLAQTVGFIEVIVVDDGSVDETSTVLAGFCDRVQTVTHYSNRGISAARNSGIRLARAPLIAFLDSDDTWHQDKLERQLAFLSRNPGVGVVAARARWVGSDGSKIGGGHPRSPTDGAVRFEDILAARFGLTSSVVIRREVLDRIGGFDESLDTAEDYDLWLRATLVTQLIQMPDELMSYRVHSGNVSAYSRRSVQGDVKLFRKWEHAELPPGLTRTVRQRLAAALYRLAVIEARARSPKSSSLFFAALRRDPLVGLRHMPTPGGPVPRLTNLMKPWLGGAAAMLGMYRILSCPKSLHRDLP